MYFVFAAIALGLPPTIDASAVQFSRDANTNREQYIWTANVQTFNCAVAALRVEYRVNNGVWRLAETRPVLLDGGPGMIAGRFSVTRRAGQSLAIRFVLSDTAGVGVSTVP